MFSIESIKNYNCFHIQFPDEEDYMDILTENKEDIK